MNKKVENSYHIEYDIKHNFNKTNSTLNSSMTPVFMGELISTSRLNTRGDQKPLGMSYFDSIYFLIVTISTVINIFLIISRSRVNSFCTINKF